MTHRVSEVRRFGKIETAIYELNSRDEINEKPELKKIIFDKLDSCLPKDGVLSLDVFDTLLLRDISSEVTRFLEIGREMAHLLHSGRTDKGRDIIEKVDVDAFLARHLGTLASYRIRDQLRGCREGSLTEIHNVACCLLSANPGFAEKFVDAEIRYEATRMKPNDWLIEYICKAKKNGNKVILITDMYMHAHQVSRLLKILRVDTDLFDTIKSSADTLTSKAAGEIFPDIQSEMGMRPDQFLHVGDSLRGDFRQPISRGWRAIHLPITAAEIELRRNDHSKTMSMLQKEFSIEVKIAEPS